MNRRRHLQHRIAIATAVLATVVSACSVRSEPPASESKSPIIGGAGVVPGAWPMVAWLDNGCSGVLFAPDLVVFAAHCGLGASAAWLGDALTIEVDDATGMAPPEDTGNGERFGIIECHEFPGWSLASGDDVAYCILEGPSVSQRSIPAPLVGCARDALAVGQEAELVGFGRASTTDPPGEKRSVTAPIVDVGQEIEIGDAMHGTCAGDSGGPALVNVGAGDVYDWRIVGILSTGLAGDGCGVGFYTDALTVATWLADSTGRTFGACAKRSSAGECLINPFDANGREVDGSVISSVECENDEARTTKSRDVGCSVSPNGNASAGTTASLIGVLALLICPFGCSMLSARARRRPSKNALALS